MIRILLHEALKQINNETTLLLLRLPRKNKKATFDQLFFDSYRCSIASELDHDALRIVYNHKNAFLTSKNETELKEEFRHFLESQFKNPEHRARLTSTWYQEFISSIRDCLYMAVHSQYVRFMEQKGPAFLFNVNVSTKVDIFEENDGLFVDVEACDIKIQISHFDGEIQQTETVCEIPGCVFFRFQLNAQSAILQKVAVSNVLLYDLITKKEGVVELSNATINRASMEESSLALMQASLNESISRLETLLSNSSEVFYSASPQKISFLCYFRKQYETLLEQLFRSRVICDRIVFDVFKQLKVIRYEMDEIPEWLFTVARVAVRFSLLASSVLVVKTLSLNWSVTLFGVVGAVAVGRRILPRVVDTMSQSDFRI